MTTSAAEATDHLRGWLRAARRRVLYIVERYDSDRCRDSAAALTYMSLFALVPLLTVVYSLATVAPAYSGMEEKIQDLVFENLVPETSAGLAEYVEDFSRQARNLTSFGVAFLVVTAVLMLRNIEQAFNRIWRTDGNRATIASFLLYWAVLSLSPITIGLGLAVSTYLASFASILERWDIIGVGALLLRLAPYALQALGFTLVYAAVPNCRVPLRHALIGGIIAAASFNIARALFTKLVAGSSITFIYGAFAAVPLFLLWVYISWNIVLICAIGVHGLSAYESEAQARRPLLLKALEVLHILWTRQARGESVGELDMLRGGEASIDSGSWQRIRQILQEQRVITRDERGRYLLARDLHETPLWQLQEWLGVDGSVPESLEALPAWEQHAYHLLQHQREKDREMLSISLAELFRP
jgi:membrane protein